MAEKKNREMRDAVRKFISRDPSFIMYWGACLIRVAVLRNHKISATTKLCPHETLFGSFDRKQYSLHHYLQGEVHMTNEAHEKVIAAIHKVCLSPLLPVFVSIVTLIRVLI